MSNGYYLRWLVVYSIYLKYCKGKEWYRKFTKGFAVLWGIAIILMILSGEFNWGIYEYLGKAFFRTGIPMVIIPFWGAIDHQILGYRLRQEVEI